MQRHEGAHVDLKDREGRLPCPQAGCEHQSTTKADLEKHMKRVHATAEDKAAEHKCPRLGLDGQPCTYTHYQACVVVKHVAIIHDGECPLPCREGCDQRFSTHRARRDHERTHTGEQYTCSVCAASFPIYKGLDNHRRKTGHRG